MKVRRGLVSNSSSSSFLLFLNRIPESKEEVRDLLFPGLEKFPKGTSGKGFDPLYISGLILHDMRRRISLTREEIIEEVEYSYGPPYSIPPIKMKNSFLPWPEENDPDKFWEALSQRKIAQDKVEKEWDENKEELIDEYLKEVGVENKIVFCLIYGDGDGQPWCCLEHEGAFENIEHIRVSHH